MTNPSLPALADVALQSLRRLRTELSESSDSTLQLVDIASARVEMLRDLLLHRDEKLGALSKLLADRLNNLLMTVQTAADLLRAEQGSTRVSAALATAVDSGRSSVDRLRRALEELR